MYMCVCYKELSVIQFFPTLWVFSVELHGPAIPEFRINYFSTRSQLLWCSVCVYMLCFEWNVFCVVHVLFILNKV